MGSLQILDKLDQIEILYEPIYSADGHCVIGYEVIGQVEVEGKQINLEQFTYDLEVPEDIRAEIEQLFVRQALAAVKQDIHEVNLYIPCNPNLLMLDFGDSYFGQLKEELSEAVLPNVTLVMTEHLFTGDIKQLQHVIRYMKTYGVKIALANVNSQSHLENILMLEPAVLKINVEQLNYNLWGAQNHVFSTLRTLALKMGAALLIENIDTVYQLQHGWKNGARYYKGAYLQAPQKEFIEGDSLKERFRDECEQFITTEKKLLAVKYEELKRLEKTILAIVEQLHPTSDDEQKFLRLAYALQQYAFRIYICDSEGFQTTPNIMRYNQQWVVQHEAKGKNWSWRPYFLLNIIRMEHGMKGKFSNAYSDIETGEQTRTFSMALPNNEFLFIDITYDYLYEHNIVN